MTRSEIALLSEAEKRARHKAQIVAWNKANPEKVKAAQARSRAKHKEKRNKASLEWMRTHPESAAVSKKRHYQNNKERVLQNCAEYRKKNAAAIKARKANDYKKNIEAERLRKAAAYKKNAEKVKAAVAKYQAANPEKVRVFHQNRRIRKLEGEGRLSSDLIPRLMKLQKSKCAVCKVDLTNTVFHLDHHMPLALGGPHEDSNTQLLCATCNCQKGAKHPVDFMQSRGFLI